MQQPNKPPLTVVFSSPSNYLLNADQVNTLRGKYRCTSIVHDWTPDHPITPGALHLTHAEPGQVPRSLLLQGVSIIGRGWNPPLFPQRSIHG